MSVTAALLKLDESLDPILLGTLAALAVVAATVVWQSQRNRGSTRTFSIAAGLFLAGLLVDVAVFPMLQDFVTVTTETDLLGNFSTTLADTASQYVLLLLGGGALLAGTLSLTRVEATAQGSEPAVQTPTDFQRDILETVRDALAPATTQYVHQTVGGAEIKAFRRDLTTLSRLAYLTRTQG